MGEYIKGFWGGLSTTGRTVISVVVALVLLAAFWLALTNVDAFSGVTDSLDKLLH